MEEVRLNGRNLRVVWCKPWSIEITGTVRPGRNELEIAVVKERVNRLIGDSGKPQEERLTWTTWNPCQPDSPLLPSGLLGPITRRGNEGSWIQPRGTSPRRHCLAVGETSRKYKTTDKNRNATGLVVAARAG